MVVIAVMSFGDGLLCLRPVSFIAISMHIRACDFGRNLFVNALGMLALCVFTLVVSFLV